MLRFLLLALALTSCTQNGTGSLPHSGADARSHQQQRAEMTVQAGSVATPVQTEVEPKTSSPTTPAVAAAECGNGIREGSEVCDGDCPAECISAACVQLELRGAASMCDAQCVPTEIDACVDGDGCCPSGCSHATDEDCSPSCGDGVVSSGERCEPGSSVAPCPSVLDCDDRNPCTEDKLIGDAQLCSAQCVHLPITLPGAADGCCPSAADVGTDSDCSAACGDGVVSAGEQCDPAIHGSCPTSATCAQLTSRCMRGVLVGNGCDARCELEEISSPHSGDGCCPFGANAGNDSDCSPACGDGAVSEGEECDPNVPDGEYGRCPVADSDCSLPSSDPCQKGVLIGDPQQCTAHCSFGPRQVGLADACCPSSATSREDPDCEAVCGNGLLEKGELCDDGPGSPRTCPTYDDCAYLDRQGAGCTGRRLAGSANLCTAQCESYEIVQAIAGDSCCPSTQSPSTDPDCSDTGSMYGQCTWASAYPPSYDQSTGKIDASASLPYGCDGTYSVCSAQWCEPLCNPGDTTDSEGRAGRCVKAFPYAFEVFCDSDADCPADRECGTTNSSTVKTCLRGLRRT